jgi:VanZ family protein
VRDWTLRRWVTAGVSAVVFVLVIAIPTALIPNPVFGRMIPPTWWAWPALVVSSVLAGLLVATYVNPEQPERRRERRGGWVGAFLTYFAVGCPVCNKLVLLALGSAGAVSWFAPVQPYLQLLAVVVLGWALRERLKGERVCKVTPRVEDPVR